MGTKTENEAGIETGTEAQRDKAGEPGKGDGTPAIGEVEEVRAAGEDEDGGPAGDRADSEVLDAGADEDAADDTGRDAATAGTGSGVAMGAAAVVSAGLGIVSLTGGWLGGVAQARSSLKGQLETAQGADVAAQVKVLTDSWNANALVAGFFALAALVIGVVVLVRPAFGNPDRIPAQSPWIKSVAWAGVALGVVGLLLAALKYSDILLGMPSTG
ncbi:hypothetical protein ACFYXC_23890 [Streptomyces sp. NPDC002701]|uniref:hypothetical protein n=1 Tax=unclassified Streptomyces TaxID=2593676 RepID=UPI00368EF566